MAEYTPELSDAVLQNLLKKIKEREMQDVASAQGEAARRGIAGSSFEANRVGAAQRTASDASVDAQLQLALANAERLRSERLIQEERTYQSGESEKGRLFSREERVGSQQHGTKEREASQGHQEKMQNLQNEYQTLETEKQRAYQTGETNKAREFEAMQLKIQQDFQAEENELSRIQQTNLQALGAAQEEAAARRQQRHDLLNTGIGGLAGIGGQVVGGLFAKGAAGAGAGTAASGAAGAAGAAPAVGGLFGTGAGLLGGGVLAAANTAGSAWLGQKAGSAVFGGNSRGVKAGSLIGGIGGPVAGAVGGVVGGALGKTANAVKKVFCFLADTPITMADGSIKSIAEVRLGDDVVGGAVESVRKAFADDLYDYHGVKVTGMHAVKEGGKWIRVKDSINALPLRGTWTVYSLVTSDHQLHINGITFADEQETNFYEEFSIDQSLHYLNNVCVGSM